MPFPPLKFCVRQSWRHQRDSETWRWRNWVLRGDRIGTYTVIPKHAPASAPLKQTSVTFICFPSEHNFPHHVHTHCLYFLTAPPLFHPLQSGFLLKHSWINAHMSGSHLYVVQPKGPFPPSLLNTLRSIQHCTPTFLTFFPAFQEPQCLDFLYTDSPSPLLASQLPPSLFSHFPLFLVISVYSEF